MVGGGLIPCGFCRQSVRGLPAAGFAQLTYLGIEYPVLVYDSFGNTRPPGREENRRALRNRLLHEKALHLVVEKAHVKIVDQEVAGREEKE